MKSTLSIVGIFLIIVGILALSYQSFTYTKNENVALIGDLKVTAETQKTVNLPPILGGLSIVAGLVLVFAGRK